jgi:GH25 family lysozyme M1 (1,4-beta-N-acetylmuramidase)
MNRLKRLYNKAIRSRKRVSPERLKELRNRCEHDWIGHADVLGVGQSENGIVVFQNIEYDNVLFYSSDNSFDAYTDSPLEVIKTKPFSMSDWQTEEVKDKEFITQAVVPTRRIRPIYGGLSIGHKDITAGTLSMIVRDKTTKELLILGNNHVLANLNKGKKGDEILQPGKVDGGNIPGDVVGYLERFVEMKNNATADCAVAKPVSDEICRYGILNCGDVWFLTDPVVGMAIEGFGRTTGFQVGKVVSINTTVKVGAGEQTYTVKEVFVSDIPSDGGDSGRALNERYTAKCAGLLFAGNGSQTLGVTSRNVFNQLNIELMPCPYNIVLDLSHYNGHLTREMIRHAKAMGVVGMIFKMSEGNYRKDTEFDNNVACAEAEGMPWTGYHWNKPAITAEEQYRWLIKCLGNHIPSFQIMLDNEDIDGCNSDKVTSVSLSLLKKIDDHFVPLGYKNAIYYTRGSWHNPNTLRSSEWKKYKLDAARYYVDQVKYPGTDQYFPLDWDNAVLWQCKADRDYLAKYFLGDDAPCNHVDVNYVLDQIEFDSWLVHIPTPEPPPDEPEPPEEPGEPNLKTGTHYYGKTIVGLNVRNAPKATATKLGTMSANTQFEWFEEIKEGNNIWLRIGWREYCAKKYGNSVYVEYITV